MSNPASGKRLEAADHLPSPGMDAMWPRSQLALAGLPARLLARAADHDCATFRTRTPPAVMPCSTPRCTWPRTPGSAPPLPTAPTSGRLPGNGQIPGRLVGGGHRRCRPLPRGLHRGGSWTALPSTAFTAQLLLLHSGFGQIPVEEVIAFEWQPDGGRRRLESEICGRTRAHDLVASGLLAPATDEREDRTPAAAAGGGRYFLRELAWRKIPSKS